PTLRAARDASDLEPGLLQVDDVARGAVSLGNGVYAQIGSGGLVVNRRARVVWRGVDRGSPVTAAVGRLRWRGGVGDEVLQADEQVDRSLGNVRLTGRRLEANAVVYTGRISDGDPLAAGALPLTLTVTRRVQDSRVVLTADVPGASAVAWHEYRRAGYSYRGLGAQPSAAVLRDGRYPLVPRRPVAGDGWVDRLNARTDGSGAVTLAPVRFWLGSDGTGVGVDGSAHAVVDLRHAGRVDTTVWDETARLRVYDGRPTQVLAQHASDLPPVTPPPTWATSGALVGVHGSPDVVRRSVQRLLDADAVVAAAVVPDGGATARYPGWTRLVERLRDRDVRVVASVSPAFAPSPRPGDPAAEQRLLATARRQGWLVRSAAGEARVPVADVDRGTVPGALLDLTDPDAVEWYAGQLAGRLRAERLSGWVVEGGAELPPDARLADGSGATERGGWPSRWARLVRDACDRAGTDCLTVQAAADETTPAATGALSLDVPDLPAVVAATANAGVSGAPFVHAAVPGAVDDDVAARWAQLQTWGTLLRTDASVGPLDWSAARVASLARSSRLVAASASYRRSVLRDAVASGEPVVRPVTVDEPGLTQPSTAAGWFFGDSLLVVPVLRAGERSVRAGLPPGDWVELFTGRRHEGTDLPDPPPGVQPSTATATQVELDAPLDREVVLYRADDPDAQRLRSALRAAGLLR
ncbi:TIM-barrel domain-containing protein, partial [Angustibacter aerolatus]